MKFLRCSHHSLANLPLMICETLVSATKSKRRPVPRTYTASPTRVVWWEMLDAKPFQLKTATGLRFCLRRLSKRRSLAHFAHQIKPLGLVPKGLPKTKAMLHLRSPTFSATAFGYLSVWRTTIMPWMVVLMRKERRFWKPIENCGCLAWSPEKSSWGSNWMMAIGRNQSWCHVLGPIVCSACIWKRLRFKVVRMPSRFMLGMHPEMRGWF